MMPNLRNARFRDHEIGSYTDYFYGSFADEYTRHKAKTVYEDKQNVHDTSVQQSVCDSIKRLCTDPKPAFTIEMLVQADIDADVIETIRVFGRDGTRHSICGLTYVELLGYVWQRIEQHESRSELYRVLQQQVRESCDVCFTGRFNRLLSVLVGFSEDITITISDQAQIAAVILAIKARVDPYNSNTHADLARTELLDLGYSSEDTQPWLDAITSQ
ncbi:Hypothetical protein MVR_LOCUS172 [uncultured virus]|nr:Hypothetical protein MVR_LOCUS172 [uncultured virus]